MKKMTFSQLQAFFAEAPAGGADPTGTNDSTAAINGALAAGMASCPLGRSWSTARTRWP